MIMRGWFQKSDLWIRYFVGISAWIKASYNPQCLRRKVKLSFAENMAVVFDICLTLHTTGRDRGGEF
jgi:hypothetical protein